jgi:hypothetical protein
VYDESLTILQYNIKKLKALEDLVADLVEVNIVSSTIYGLFADY